MLAVAAFRRASERPLTPGAIASVRSPQSLATSNGFEIRIARGYRQPVAAAFDRKPGSVDREFDIHIAAGDDHFEAAGFGGLDQSRRRVLVDVQSGQREPASLFGSDPNVIEVDIELVSKHVRPINKQPDALAFVRHYRTVDGRQISTCRLAVERRQQCQSRPIVSI